MPALVESPPFGIGVTRTNFKQSGKISVRNDKLIIWHKTWETRCLILLKTEVENVLNYLTAVTDTVHATPLMAQFMLLIYRHSSCYSFTGTVHATRLRAQFMLFLYRHSACYSFTSTVYATNLRAQFMLLRCEHSSRYSFESIYCI